MSPKQRRRKVVPVWDAKNREFWYDGRLVKRSQRDAPEQMLVLAASAELRWRQTIDNPLSVIDDRCLKKLTEDVASNLNRRQVAPRLGFACQDGGRAIGWYVR